MITISLLKTFRLQKISSNVQQVENYEIRFLLNQLHDLSSSPFAFFSAAAFEKKNRFELFFFFRLFINSKKFSSSINFFQLFAAHPLNSLCWFRVFSSFVGSFDVSSVPSRDSAARFFFYKSPLWLFNYIPQSDIGEGGERRTKKEKRFKQCHKKTERRDFDTFAPSERKNESYRKKKSSVSWRRATSW